MSERKRTPWVVALIGGGILMLGPVFGLFATALGLRQSFRALSDSDPSTRSAMLAEGISHSMTATAVGLALFPVGAIVVGVSLWQLLRKPAARRQNEP